MLFVAGQNINEEGGLRLPEQNSLRARAGCLSAGGPLPEDGAFADVGLFIQVRQYGLRRLLGICARGCHGGLAVSILGFSGVFAKLFYVLEITHITRGRAGGRRRDEGWQRSWWGEEGAVLAAAASIGERSTSRVVGGETFFRKKRRGLAVVMEIHRFHVPHML